MTRCKSGRNKRRSDLTTALAALGMAAMVLPTAAHAQDDATQAKIDKAMAIKTGEMSKMGAGLAAVYERHQASTSFARSAEPADSGALSAADLSRVVDGKVLIDAVAAGSTAALLQDLEALGLERGSSFGRIVSGWLPVEALDEAAALGSLQQARPAASMANIGSVTSQGDPSMKSDFARFIFGASGKGTTVGVLSDSYDCLGGAAADIDSKDLPPANRITVLEEGACPGSDEGRGMMQLIRDVAPRASQAFHTAFGGQADFANGIIELADQANSDIVVDDVIYFAEPMFQDGIIAQAVDQVKAAGVPYFSSAGNNGRNSWESSERGFVGSGILGPFGGERHDFDPDPNVVDDLQTVVLGTGVTRFVLQWDEPFASVSGAPGSANDVDILLYLPGGIFTGIASADANIGGDPVEILGVVNSGPPAEVEIGIELFDGPAPGFMKYVVFDPRVETIGDPAPSFVVEFPTDSGTNYGHSNAAGAAGVGAAFWRNTPRFGVFPPEIENFSSAGGTPILFDLDGTPIGPEDREKPDFTAPDGGVTTFFGGRNSFGETDPDGNHFFGTSAAAPHAAAVAALMLDVNDDLSPDDVYRILEDTAIEMDDPATPGFDFGFDTGTGHGYVNAIRAVLRAKLEGKFRYYRHDDDDGEDDIASAQDDE